MNKHICETCGKEFTQSRYTAHINRKTPCKKPELTNKPKIEEQQTNKLTKPILKWVGGKTQIIDTILSEFPREMNNYREIFLGGGSVLLALLTEVKRGTINIQGRVHAYDVNEPLICVYKNIQSKHEELYEEIQTIIQEFDTCGDGEVNRKPATIEEAMESKENYYYWVRSGYNQLTPEEKRTPLGSAMFIFLNKTCFRGVFRVGPNGFNVPYGHYDNPEIINKEHLNEVHELIQRVTFECCDYKESLKRVEEGDFAYLDPPYAPETETSFVGYTENGFNHEQHVKLFEMIHELTKQNKRMMMSNADVTLVRENFANEKYNTTSIVCRRAINSKNPESKTREVVIKNY